MVGRRLRQALGSSDQFAALWAAVAALLASGEDRGGLLRQLEWLRSSASTEAEEDAILDVMDHVAGWCSPGREL